jgi:hypothetical protein
MALRKGSLNTPTVPIQGNLNLNATKGANAMGGLMGMSDVGVPIKQIESIQIGDSNLWTLHEDAIPMTSKPSDAGATIGKVKLNTPTKDVVK